MFVNAVLDLDKFVLDLWLRCSTVGKCKPSAQIWIISHEYWFTLTGL